MGALGLGPTLSLAGKHPIGLRPMLRVELGAMRNIMARLRMITAGTTWSSGRNIPNYFLRFPWTVLRALKRMCTAAAHTANMTQSLDLVEVEEVALLETKKAALRVKDQGIKVAGRKVEGRKVEVVTDHAPPEDDHQAEGLEVTTNMKQKLPRGKSPARQGRIIQIIHYLV